MPSTAKTIGKKSETDFFRSRLLINSENTKIKIAGENSLTFPKNYDIVYIQIIQKIRRRESRAGSTKSETKKSAERQAGIFKR